MTSVRRNSFITSQRQLPEPAAAAEAKCDDNVPAKQTYIEITKPTRPSATRRAHVPAPECAKIDKLWAKASQEQGETLALHRLGPASFAKFSTQLKRAEGGEEGTWFDTRGHWVAFFIHKTARSLSIFLTQGYF